MFELLIHVALNSQVFLSLSRIAAPVIESFIEIERLRGFTIFSPWLMISIRRFLIMAWMIMRWKVGSEVIISHLQSSLLGR